MLYSACLFGGPHVILLDAMWRSPATSVRWIKQWASLLAVPKRFSRRLACAAQPRLEAIPHDAARAELQAHGAGRAATTDSAIFSTATQTRCRQPRLEAIPHDAAHAEPQAHGASRAATTHGAIFSTATQTRCHQLRLEAIPRCCFFNSNRARVPPTQARSNPALRGVG